MKFRVGKKQPPQRSRQRHDSGQQSAPPAYSYHAQRATRQDAPGRQPSSLVTQRNRLLSFQFWARRSGLVLVTLAIIICLVSIVSLSTQPRIVLLDEGNTYAFQAPERYQQAAAKQLSGSIWNRNKITINTGAAAAALQKQFPELSQVSITLPLIGHRPIYYLQANAPALVIQTLNGAYVLDSHGKALIAKDRAPEAIVNNLPVITDQTGLKVALGKQIISSSNADFIHQVLTTLQANHLTVASLILPPSNAQQLDVRLTGQPYTIKFDMHDSGAARQQIGTYLATAHSLQQQGKTPAQYIDVRVPGRVYYQ